MARRRTMLSADGKAVWFWHPLLVLNLRRRVGPTGLRQTFNPQMTVTRRIRRRGERGISRKTIARGMPVDPSEPVVTTLVCFVLFRTRGCGCSGHPAFPAPSVFLGERFLQNLGRIAPRECGVVSGAFCVVAHPSRRRFAPPQDEGR